MAKTTLVVAGLVFGITAFFTGQQTAMKECPKTNQSEKLIYSEQRKEGVICNYSSGWNFYGHKKISKRAK